MAIETELKFAIQPEALQPLEQYLIRHFGQSAPAKSLLNSYYETADQFLRRHDMGLRIRGEDENYEMTLKTAGQTLGGLYQRPEYNVLLQQPELELTKLPATVWPADCDIRELSRSLKPLFSTNFTRQIWLLTEAETEIELALDSGSITADGQVQALLEVEMELKTGSVQSLFDFARAFISNNPGAVRLSNVSKAERGYQLALKQASDTIRNVTAPVLAKKLSCETAMQQLLSYLLTEWQYLDRVWLAGSLDFTAQASSLLATIRQGILLFGGLIPRKASQEIRRLLTQLETDFLTAKADPAQCCFHQVWVNAQLSLTQWLVLQQWRQHINSKQANLLAGSYKRWSDTQLSRTAATINQLAAQLSTAQHQAQLLHSLRQQLSLMQLLSSYYPKQQVEQWLAAWMPLLTQTNASRQIIYQQARKLPDYWLSGKNNA